MNRPLAAAAAALFLVVSVSLSGPTQAEVQTITASHTYVMGDRDSKNEARRLCLLEAERKLAEQAGVFVQVLSKTENFQLTEDEIETFAAAILQVRVDKEEIVPLDQTMALTLHVSADVDPDAVRQELARYARERTRPGEDASPDSLASTEPGVDAPSADIPAKATDPDKEKARMEQDWEQATRDSARLVEKGMSLDEVTRLLGPPRAQKRNKTSLPYLGYNYGDNWVVFQDGVVGCVRNRLQYSPKYKGEAHCEGFAFTFVLR